MPRDTYGRDQIYHLQISFLYNELVISLDQFPLSKILSEFIKTILFENVYENMEVSIVIPSLWGGKYVFDEPTIYTSNH